MVDTWLPRHSIVYTAHAVPSVPTVGVVEERPTYKDHLAAHLVQLRGLADLYYRFPDRSWYYIVGDDTYLNMDYALQMLDGYDATLPLWITKSRYPPTPIHIPFDESTFPNRTLGSNFTWSSGSWGWFLSNPVAKAFAEAWPTFERTHEAEHCFCPDLVTGELLTLLGFDITPMPDPRYSLSYDAVAVDATDHSRQSERAHYHYLTPRKLLAAHWRALHEKLDRIHAAGDKATLLSWKQDFDEHHQKIMQQKRRLADMLCGSPQNLQVPALAGNMRTRIDAHMSALWMMQARIVDMETSSRNRTASESRGVRTAIRNGSSRVSRSGRIRNYVRSITIYDIPRGTTHGCAK